MAFQIPTRQTRSTTSTRHSLKQSIRVEFEIRGDLDILARLTEGVVNTGFAAIVANETAQREADHGAAINT